MLSSFRQNNSQKNSRNSSSKSHIRAYTTTIRLVGDRGSGKTTYLATLLRYPYTNRENNPVRKIVPMGSTSERLEIEAMNILEEGKKFNPTLVTSADKDPQYGTTITLKDTDEEMVEITIITKDYGGELFRDIHILQQQQVEDYLRDCSVAEGILFLIDGTSYREDSKYEASMKKFIRMLDTQADGWKGRIAFTLTKCEDMEIYHRRKQLTDQELVERLFPKTVQALYNECSEEIAIEYFTLSSFGVIGSRGEANIEWVVDDTVDPPVGYYKLRNPNKWKPFGLISPLYWLSTGKKYPDLDDL